LVLATQPTQVTLVPDAEGQLTSNHGWDTQTHQSYLADIIALFKSHHIRTSIFVDANIGMIEGAALTGTDRVELYTESYAHHFSTDPATAIAPFVAAAEKAHTLGLGLNAGHDLSLENLAFFKNHIPHLLEVSIGHALVCDALWYGLENTVQLYKRQLTLKR
jgi:pyridoxine 5-phosphate synthase